jgi:methionyl-tRNA formyltransferase
MNGETVTGVTTFRLKHEIDTGDILLQQAVPILPNDNAGTMHDKLMEAGATLLVTTVQGLAAGTLREIPQTAQGDQPLKHAPKIFREDTILNWQLPGIQLHNQVRGLSPHPAASAQLAGKGVKLYTTRWEAATHTATPGSYETDHQHWLRFATTDGWLYVLDLQLEGKKRMLITDFLRGFRG